MENTYRFFQNRDCRYFPCHPVEDIQQFNCLFCYCPLYTLGERCGGNCTYTEKGVKNCTHCVLPHSPGGYDYIRSKFPELAELARKNHTQREG